MLNNFCFDVFAQKWVFEIMSHATCCMSHVTLRMSLVICQMLMLILGTCWTTFVFMSMLKSVSLSSCQVVKLSSCQVWSLGHAEQVLFPCLCSKVAVYSWKWQSVFLDIIIISTLSTDITVSRAGSQLKIVGWYCWVLLTVTFVVFSINYLFGQPGYHQVSSSHDLINVAT